jgi:hypothetical protein
MPNQYKNPYNIGDVVTFNPNSDFIQERYRHLIGTKNIVIGIIDSNVVKLMSTSCNWHTDYLIPYTSHMCKIRILRHK